MKSFIKRISFFLIYLPALIFSCQYSYFTGICEALGMEITSLGMNYSEVTFFGFLKLSSDFMKIFTFMAIKAFYLLCFL